MRYELQKLIREVNRNPGLRTQFLAEPDTVFARYKLTDEEKAALVKRDYGKLYRMGVHGLLLRPFTILFQIPEKDYLDEIRRTGDV